MALWEQVEPVPLGFGCWDFAFVLDPVTLLLCFYLEQNMFWFVFFSFFFFLCVFF